MKLALTSSVAALCLLCAPAMSADLPSRKGPVEAPIYVPVFTWTGFYIGLNAGVGWQNNSRINVTGPNGLATSIGSGSNNVGFVGGGQVGYNYQVGSWVFGAEADIQYADLGGRLNWGDYNWWGRGGNDGQYFGTVRARIGYAVDRFLVYATGGFAYGGLNNSWHNSDTATGWTLGGGVEYAFTNNWTARLEALYVNLDSGNRSLIYDHPGGVLPAGRYAAHSKGGDGGGIVRVGVNYKF